jgi:PleD family two-component response regulator
LYKKYFDKRTKVNLFYFLQVFGKRCKISTASENARRKRILLVDDELDITVTLEMALEESGFFQVEAFYDPVLALSRFKAEAYDLAILDIKMPEWMALSYIEN